MNLLTTHLLNGRVGQFGLHWRKTPNSALTRTNTIFHHAQKALIIPSDDLD